METQALEAKRARLLDHAMHEEGIFYSRLNFFLLFESVLLGSVIQTATLAGERVLILQIMAIALGLAVLIVWRYAQVSKLKYIIILENGLSKHLPEFSERENDESLNMAKGKSDSATAMITYWIPFLVLMAWVGVTGALLF
jgi:hypothetical protein